MPAAILLPDARDVLQTRGFGGLYPGDGCKDATGCGRCAAKVHFSKWTDADWCTRPIGIKVDYRTEAFQGHAQGWRGVNLMDEAGHAPGEEI